MIKLIPVFNPGLPAALIDVLLPPETRSPEKEVKKGFFRQTYELI